MSKLIFRIEKNKDNPFVMIDKRPIENPALSWRAKGVLAYLLSRPDNWVMRLGDLLNRATDRPHSVRQTIRELRQAGHIHMKAKREDGRLVEWVYEVYELPFCPDPTLKPLIPRKKAQKSPDVEIQQVEIQQVENQHLNNKDSTDTEKNKYGANAPLDWKIAYDLPITESDLGPDGKYKDAANLIATGMGIYATPAYELAYAFMCARKIIIPTGKIKGQRKPIAEMIEMGVRPEHVVEAVKKLLEANLTVTDLYSVSKTATDLANKTPEDNGYNPQGLEINV